MCTLSDTVRVGGAVYLQNVRDDDFLTLFEETVFVKSGVRLHDLGQHLRHFCLWEETAYTPKNNKRDHRAPPMMGMMGIQKRILVSSAICLNAEWTTTWTAHYLQSQWPGQWQLWMLWWRRCHFHRTSSSSQRILQENRAMPRVVWQNASIFQWRCD